MRPQQHGGAPQGGQPLRSVIDFGGEGNGTVPASRLESGGHSRSGSVDRGIGHMGGGGGGGQLQAQGQAQGDGSLSFYASDAMAVPRGGTPPLMGAALGGGMQAVGPISGGAKPPMGAMGGGKLLGISRVYSSTGAFLGEGFEDEPPILEELGINLSHVLAKTKAVLHPRKTQLSAEYLQDSDLAGPLVFCMVLGMVLLLKGKVSFGSIYGCGAVGCAGMYAVLNLMSQTGIDIYRTISVLGYCLLPIVLLAAISVFVELRGAVGYILIPLGVLWCTNAAALFFVVALGLDDQRWLVAYPVMLFYACFALISVF